MQQRVRDFIKRRKAEAEARGIVYFDEEEAKYQKKLADKKAKEEAKRKKKESRKKESRKKKDRNL